MAKIIKVGIQNPTFTPKAGNLAKTARAANHGNPFQFTNFEGTTLPFAEVFDGFKPKETNKMKLIASSVAGSMHKMRSSITEPIARFVGRIGESLTNAWDYAKNTNFTEVAGIKQINALMQTPVNLPNIKGLSGSIDFLNKDIKTVCKDLGDSLSGLLGLGNDIKTKWNNMISNLKSNKISADMPVAELEQLWKDEIALELGGAA